MILEIYPLINKYGMSSNIYGSMVVIYGSNIYVRNGMCEYGSVRYDK